MGARVAAFAVCVAPLLVCLAVVAFGHSALLPWRDWSCALPLGLLAGACFDRHPEVTQFTPRHYLYLVPAFVLTLASWAAHLKSRPWAMWLIAAANFVYFFACVALVIAIDGKNASYGRWVDNWDWFFLVLLSAPIFAHIERFATRRLRVPPVTSPAAAPNPASPAA